MTLKMRLNNRDIYFYEVARLSADRLNETAKRFDFEIL